MSEHRIRLRQAAVASAEPFGLRSTHWTTSLTAGIRDICLVAICTVGWLWLASLSLHTGLPYRLFADQLARHEDEVLGLSLYVGSRAQPCDAVVLGDGLFVQAVLPHIPKTKTACVISLPRFDIDTAKTALPLIAPWKTQRIFVQNSPYFWSNMYPSFGADGIAAPIAPRHNLALWDAIHGSPSVLGRITEATLLFDTLGKAAKAAKQKKASLMPRRPKTLMNVSYDGERVYRRLLDSDQAVYDRVKDRLVWISDTRFLPDDMDPALLQQFQQRFPDGGTDPHIGQFTDLLRVGSVMAGEG